MRRLGIQRFSERGFERQGTPDGGTQAVEALLHDVVGGAAFDVIGGGLFIDRARHDQHGEHRLLALNSLQDLASTGLRQRMV